MNNKNGAIIIVSIILLAMMVYIGFGYYYGMALIEDGARMDTFKFPKLPKEFDTVTFLRIDTNKVDSNTIITNSGDTFKLNEY